MITLKTKYFISKMLWGLFFVVCGMAKLWTLQSSNELIYNVGNVVCWVVFLATLAAEFYIEKKKVEPEDELAVKNQLRAKSLIYQGIFVLMVVYLLFGSAMKFTINSGVSFVVLGVFQILEYVFFEVFERKEMINFE